MTVTQKPYHKYWRFDPKATTNEIGLTAKRLDRLYAFFLHGYLATDMLHALVDSGVSQKFTTEELKRLKRIPNRYLEQPKQQEDSLDARSSRLIYRISPRGVEALVNAGRIATEDAQLWRKLRSQQKENQFWHDAATSYISASIALGTAQLGLQFISVYDIIRDAPAKTRDASNPLSMPYEKSFFTPDLLCGFRDQSQATYLMHETDMGTEQTMFHEVKNSTLSKKYLGYRSMLYRDLHTAQFGIPSVKILFATTMHGRLSNLKKAFKQIADQDTRAAGVGPIYLRCLPELDRHNHMKLAATGTLLLDPWQRVTADPTYLHKKKTAA
jgi:hypothetical protein